MLSTNSRPKTITVILVMLLLLSIVSAASLLTSQLRFGVQGRQAGGNFVPSTRQNNNGFTPGQGNNQNQGGNRNFQGRTNQGGFNLFNITRSLGISPFVMIYFNLGLSIIGIAFVLLSAWGIWKLKVWGLNLAMLMALIFLAGALPTLFSLGGRNVNWLRTSLNIISLLATLPVLALGFLPSVRDYFPKPAPKRRSVS